MIRSLWLWGPVLGYMGLIFWVSHQPKGGEALMAIAPDVWWHSVEYAVLGFLIFRAARPTWSHWSVAACCLLALVAGSLYGASDELHQSFIPTRHTSFHDWVADTIGAGLGGCMAWGWEALRRRAGGSRGRLDTPASPR